MIKFTQKSFTEYDAMRSLYVELCKRGDRQKWRTTNKNSLLPILNGNSVVIEKFVISTSFFGKDKYRMYIKIGAKAKMPDEVRLPEGKPYDKKLLGTSVSVGGGAIYSGRYPTETIKINGKDVEMGALIGAWQNQENNNNQNNNQNGSNKPFTSEQGNTSPGGGRSNYNTGGNGRTSQTKFKQKGESTVVEYGRQKLFGKNNNNNGPKPFISTNLDIPSTSINYEVRDILGEAIKYNKKERSLVLEFADIDSAIRALNILPFGVDYNIYLLT